MRELADALWAEIKAELADRSLFASDTVMRTDLEEVDSFMVSAIEAAFIKAASTKIAHDEDRLCLVDKTVIEIDKPVEGRFRVGSASFSKRDYRVLIQRGQELCVREFEDKLLIVTRQQA